MMRNLLFISFCVLSLSGLAQVSINTLAVPYTQNFDSLSNDTTFTTAHAMNLNGWAIFERGTSAAVNNQYRVNTGSSNAGDVYSYGTALASDRSLGSIASGSNLPAYGVSFQNNTGGSITQMNVTYRGEQWRSGDTISGNIDTVIFEYSTTATGIDDTMASWIQVGSLTLNTINTATTVSGAIDGNASPNFNSLTGIISVLIPNSGKIHFRWRDINRIGNDDGLAIDDLNVSFSSSGNPKPSIVSTTPPDNATMVSPGTVNLTMTFDQTVSIGTGNITVYNLSDATQQVIACSATTVSASTVTVPGVNLLPGKQYAVQFDSTGYVSGGGANSFGIYDNTSWNFETMATGLTAVRKTTLNIFQTQDAQLGVDLMNTDATTIVISDMQGKKVKQFTQQLQAGRHFFNMNQWIQESGLFTVQVLQNGYQGSILVNIP